MNCPYFRIHMDIAHVDLNGNQHNLNLATIII